jgi:uncharacterized membrane protein YhfC
MKSSRILIPLLIIFGLGGIAAGLVFNPSPTLHLLNGLLMLALPITLALFLARRLKTSWSLFGAGALTFVASQALHLPFNQFVLNPAIRTLGLESTPNSPDLLLIGLLGGLSAGLFEETARLVAYRRFLTDRNKWKDGLMFGAGHGGIEAMLLGVLAVYIFFKALALRDLPAGSLEAVVGPGRVAATQAFLQAYWGASWYDSLLGALERVSAMAVHLSLSVMVLQVNRRGQLRWYWLAVFYHTLVDMTAVYGAGSWGVYMVEGILLLLAAFSISVVFLLREKAVLDDGNPPSDGDAKPFTAIQRPEITNERLKNSQFED